MSRRRRGCRADHLKGHVAATPRVPRRSSKQVAAVQAGKNFDGMFRNAPAPS